MIYPKRPLTYEQQADQLIQRGLAADRETLIARLRAVNYYRLSGYLFPYRQSDGTYRPGTTLDQVWRRYTFDRRLRLLVMDPIERIEVHVRTALVYELAHATGPFGYTEPSNLPNLDGNRFGEFLAKLYDEADRSSEKFVRHYKGKYDRQGYLPIWMAAEIMSFGMMLTLFRGVEKRVKQRIAKPLDLSDVELLSWLHALNVVRNICAHHGRLWNRVLGVKPKIPRGSKHRDWSDPVRVSNERIFGILTICKYSLDHIAPQSQWPQRLRDLLNEYPEIPRNNMDFPDNWEECPIWRL